MPEPLDAAALAAPVIGPVTHLEEVSGFVGNQTYRLESESGTFYLKSAAAGAISAEAQASSDARSLGIPVPTILTVATGDPAYLISEAVPGNPADASATEAIRAAGTHLRLLHVITGPAYGIVSEDLHPTWPDFLSTATAHLDEIVPADLADRLRAHLPPAIAQLPATRPALLHGDLHPRHLYTEGTTLTAIIDWSDATYGDPLYDLARFSISAPTEALLDGYGLQLTPAIERTFSLYRIVWSLIALYAEHRAGGDWFDAHIVRITKELAG
ncbi:phosphotransferase family protein [Kribbella capetownensis]|uniref:phosphotransferase family protein n=1 Tax=Kribbella capetownensis TaxID=1572659 RepID=UPI0013F3F6DD|nr:aminoglycoside phosphotransferase family protein [Kribbella capetownensis]